MMVEYIDAIANCVMALLAVVAITSEFLRTFGFVLR